MKNTINTFDKLKDFKPAFGSIVMVGIKPILAREGDNKERLALKKSTPMATLIYKGEPIGMKNANGSTRFNDPTRPDLANHQMMFRNITIEELLKGGFPMEYFEGLDLHNLKVPKGADFIPLNVVNPVFTVEMGIQFLVRIRIVEITDTPKTSSQEDIEGAAKHNPSTGLFALHNGDYVFNNTYPAYVEKSSWEAAGTLEEKGDLIGHCFLPTDAWVEEGPLLKDFVEEEALDTTLATSSAV